MDAAQHSPIEEYLRALRETGSSDSTGDFTLSLEEALQKLAAFQLPYAGAWAVKMVQAVVASGSDQPIRVSQSLLENQIAFVPGSNWKLAEIEAMFLDLSARPENDLNHLRTALWAVGLAEGLHFTLTDPGDPLALHWNGLAFERTSRAAVKIPELTAPSTWGDWSLRVGHQTARGLDLAGLLADRKTFVRNADVAYALATRAYTCPLPLSLDRRRLDGLQFCPEQTRPRTSYPLAIGFRKGNLPSFDPPVGTFERLTSKELERSWRSGYVSDQIMEKGQVSKEVSVAFLISSHHRRLMVSDRLVPLPVPSFFCWIADGVVVEVEQRRRPPSPCAIAIFLSASGLSTDLSSLRLQISEQRDQRQAAAEAKTYEALNEIVELTFSHGSDVALGVKAFGLMFGCFGAWACVSSGSLYALPMALIGWKLYGHRDRLPHSQLARIQAELQDLVDSFSSASGLKNSEGDSSAEALPPKLSQELES